MIPILLLLQSLPEQAFSQGMELARDGQWEAARKAFTRGQSAAPKDKRFPLELAGVEYRLGDYSAAARRLRRALRLDPADAYGNEFLGTLYYLDGNYEAALSRWNRIGKPRLGGVEIDPPPPVAPALLDRALLFAPGELLTVGDYRRTEARLAGLDALNSFRLELAARPGDRYDARLRWVPRPRWGAALSAASELPYQAVRLDLSNLAHRAITWSGLYRWDAQRRRAFTSLSGPLSGDPKWRWKLFGDARSETWNLGGATDFRLRKVAAGGEIRSLASERVSWSSGFDVSTRAPGLAVRYRGTADYRFLNAPEKRLTADLTGASEIARLFTDAGGVFAREQVSAVLRWLPQARGEDYETVIRAGAGWASKRTPFDELFILGLERDNDLALRGHLGTRGGKKGSAPLGRRYILTNFELYKRVYHGDWLTLDAGPALDTGRMDDGEFLIDAGAVVRLRILGSFGVALSYARDLRGGRGAYYSYPVH
ncbi:MAG TPA: tetratricopeptide repeat protein [Bryobacteraceae bacterium]|nr:tetratricopeptide repeat protein [Bryobacteraceae bacterium]